MCEAKSVHAMYKHTMHSVEETVSERHGEKSTTKLHMILYTDFTAFVMTVITERSVQQKNSKLHRSRKRIGVREFESDKIGARRNHGDGHTHLFMKALLSSSSSPSSNDTCSLAINSFISSKSLITYDARISAHEYYIILRERPTK